MTSSYSLMAIFMILALLASLGSATSHGLSASYYASSCPKLFSTVKPIVQSAIEEDARMGACLLRLFFHDCFVQGCDASVLLDDAPNFIGEKNVPPNKYSACGFEVIDEIKSAVEKVCPATVSCADIVAIAAKDSVGILNGPDWGVQLGRLDAKATNPLIANLSIPPPQADLNELIFRFTTLGFSQRDLVALIGAHTLGQAHCHTFRERIYNNESNIDENFAEQRRETCPKSPGSGDANLAPLDDESATVFDNSFYRKLVEKKGLLHSDQQFFSGEGTDSLVETYGESQESFFMDFVSAMIKLGSINPLIWPFGEIRLNCRTINPIFPVPPSPDS